MKLLFEILLSIILHPVAMILCWINIAGRTNMSPMAKFIWIIVTIIWGVGPILYILVGGGDML